MLKKLDKDLIHACTNRREKGLKMLKVNDPSLSGDELKKLPYQMKEFSESLVMSLQLTEKVTTELLEKKVGSPKISASALGLAKSAKIVTQPLNTRPSDISIRIRSILELELSKPDERQSSDIVAVESTLEYLDFFGKKFKQNKKILGN